MSEDTHQLYKEVQPQAGLQMAYTSAWTQPRKALVVGRAVGKSTDLALRLMQQLKPCQVAAMRQLGKQCSQLAMMDGDIEKVLLEELRKQIVAEDRFLLEGLSQMKQAFGPLQRHHMPLVSAMVKVIQQMPVYGANRGGDAFT